MTDTKMLQAILDKVTSVDGRLKKFEVKTEENFKKTNKRLDKIGAQIAFVEDDAPTVREFLNLEKRVTKLENKFASN